MDSLMSDWGFEEYIQIFKENEIDVNCFSSLSEDMIKELIPKIGPRAKFLQKFRLYNDNSNMLILTPTSSHQNEMIPDMNDDGESSYLSGTVSVASHRSQISISSIDEGVLNSSFLSDMVIPSGTNMEATVGLSEEEIRQTPAAKYRNQCLEKTNLEKILNMTNKGKSVLNYYKINKNFDRTTRNTLVDLLIEYETRDNVDKRITNQQFEEYANAIQELFHPTEHANIYFFYTTYKSQKVGSGKLFRRFYNYRRSLKKCGMLNSKTDKKEETSEETNDVNSCEKSEELLWLQNSCEPWRTVEQYWQSTFKMRYENLKNEGTSASSLSEYINNFPALKSNLGYTLLESDFEQLYPDATMKIYSDSWKTFSEKIVNLASKTSDKQIQAKLLEINNTGSEDEKFLRILLLLPYLLSPHTLKRKKGVGTWRPSKIEVAEGFILHINTIDDLQTKIEAKREKLKRFGLTLQPTPIIVGPSLGEIERTYVFVDGHLFLLETGIKAVDTCFKTIHSLHALYPLECESVWLLVQKAVYGITSPWDKNLTSVNMVLQELGYSF